LHIVLGVVIPSEWFLVPLFVSDEAVAKMKNVTITKYVYDPKKAQLVGSG
jgi:hypothetical protein